MNNTGQIVHSSADLLYRFKSFIFVFLLGVYIINVIYPLTLLGQLVNYITVLAVLVSIPFVGRSSRLVCMTLFIIGAYLLYKSGSGWYFWVEAIGRNTSLLMLMISVPLMGVPLKYGGYIDTLDSLAMKYMKSPSQMYWIPALFSHILGVFMNLGAVTLTHQITSRGKMKNYPGVLAKSISRGFGSALFWSPNMIATALVLGYLKVPWEDYVRLGIAFAVIALTAGYVANFFVKGALEENSEGASGESSPHVARNKLIQLLVAGSAFLSLVIYIETGTAMSVIAIIPIIALIFPVLWLLLLGAKEYIREGYGDYFKSRINRYDGEVVLFSVAGFFAAALAQSGWAEKICSYLMHFSGSSLVSVAFTILLTVVLTSMAGLHPMVSVSAFATSLDTAAMGINPVFLVLILIGGWSLGATVSPMAGTTLVVGSLTGKSPVEVGFGNIIYAFLVSAAIIIFLALN
ncbi:MAG: transporter permease [Desulfocucumaceae bacterium]